MNTENGKRQRFPIGLTFLAVIAYFSLSSTFWQYDNQTTRSKRTRRNHSSGATSNNSSYKRVSVSKEVQSISELNVPIYLIDPSSNEISVMEWKSLAHKWNRNTTYDDILQSNENINTTISFPENKKLLIFHHSSPKTASSTLRQCCQDTQRDLCGLQPQGPNNKWPAGYMSTDRLLNVIEECPKVNHYCLKADRQPLIGKYSQFHETTTFLHLFPFRNYDEWAVSALKQIYFRDVRDGGKGCLKADKLLDQCLPHKFELDFDKYPKSTMVFFLNTWKALRNTRNDLGFESNHKILMYDYRYLDKTLKSLNEHYGVPLLPGTDAKKNSERPEGSCKDEVNMLKKFHDCFSDKLRSIE